MSLSYRISLVKESPTLAISAKAIKMQKNGQDVVALSAGEPDFDTPEHIKKAAIAAIHEGKTKYTPSGGTIELKQAIVNKFERDNNLSYTVNQVLVSNGGKHSIFNALQAIISPNDEVIIPAPYWVSYPDMVLLCDGKPVIVECGYNDNYKISGLKLQQAITPKTRAIFLNSPNNPTGMVYSVQELRELANVLVQYPHIYIITDDIYEHLLFGTEKFANILNVEPRLYKQTIVINGLSKSYSIAIARYPLLL
jgi:aspartate aminotransferase